MDIPQFVCGDFNIDENDTENYRYMLNVLGAENGDIAGSLHVSYDEIDNRLARRENGSQQLIDYILLRNSGLVKNIQRRIAVFRRYHNNAPMELSDHYAVEAVVNFGI